MPDIGIDLGVLLDTLPGLAWTALPDGRAEYVGKQWLDYTGLTFEHSIGVGWIDAVHPDDTPRLLSTWGAIIASGQLGEVEARLRRRDGVYRWFLFRVCPMPGPSGEVTRWCGINFDIDDRVQAEEVGRQHQNRMERILDGLPVNARLFSPTGRIIFCNRHALEYFGATLEEIQADYAERFHPDERDVVLKAWSDSTRTGRPYDQEARLRRADGTYLWHRTLDFPLRDTEGEVELWYGLSIHIEDTRRAEAKLGGERQLLELVATGGPLSGVLEAICRQVETMTPGALCSVLIVDAERQQFHVGASLSLSAGYNAALEGVAVDPDSGPWSLAVKLKAPVISTDLANDPRWAGSPLSALAAEHGLASCWSMPILSVHGDAVATFAIYRQSPMHPTPQEADLIDRFAKIAGIAIERAQADAALKASEAQVRRAYDSLAEAQRLSHTGSFVTDLLAEEHDWSEESYRIFGFDRDAALSVEEIRATILPDDHVGFDDMIARAGAGEDVDFTFRILTAKGVLKHVRGVARVIERVEGRPLFVGALQDVTDSKLVEEALRASQAELLQAYAHLTEAQKLSRTGSFTWDVERDEHNWSAEVRRIFEFEPDAKVTLRMILEAIHPDDIPLAEAVIGGALHDDNFEVVLRIIPRGGLQKQMHVVGRRVEDITDRPVFLGAIQDITERKVAEEALNRARAELAHMSRAMTLSALTASIAHEVNQPLAGIITNANTGLRMLAADPPNLEGVRATVQRTLRDGNRASEVIQRLRAMFARQSPSLEPVDLNDAGREVLAMSAGELQQRRVVLSTDFADDLPATSGDRVQLQQVILNLVLNGADAMSEIDDRSRNLHIMTARDGPNEVRLSVQDSGEGIEPDKAEQLFQAFYTTKSDGMGIGLAISRTIIENHEGRLWAAPNEDGPGATFSFSIPNQPALDRPEAQSSSEESALVE